MATESVKKKAKKKVTKKKVAKKKVAKKAKNNDNQSKPVHEAACTESHAGKYEHPDLDEAHHSAYGRPWCLGRDYFDFLVNDLGLRRRDRVLDFGCGSGHTNCNGQRNREQHRHN